MSAGGHDAWAARVAAWARGAVPPPDSVHMLPFGEFEARYPFALTAGYEPGRCACS